MIIQEGKIVYNKDDKINSFQFDDYSIYYKGLIFVSGKKSGQESIKYIIKSILINESFQFDKIYGNFFIYIIDHSNKRQFIFIDNSGIFKAYKYKNCISTSFLELIDFFKDITIDNINYNSIVEFFHFGFTYFNNTLIEGINRIDAKEIFIFENNNHHTKEKKINSINSISKIKMGDFFSDLIYAIGDKKISVDLTGGFDSRLILSFFKKSDIKFELAISGQPNNKDIKIGKKVASKISKEFYPTYHTTKKFEIEDMYEIFKLSDAQVDIVDYHRNSQLNNDRLSRNVEIQLSGVGGELYKDFWWLHDFPFYNKSVTNLEKLYNFRIEATAFPHSLLGKRLLKNSKALKNDTIRKLKSYVLENNTKSYDNIYFNYKMKTNAGVYVTSANNYLTSYAPLLERELVKIGFGLKRRNRFFNYFHRKMISKNYPEISRIKTTDGTTTSSLIIDILLDIIFYIVDKVKRIAKQIIRKILNKTYLQETPTNQNIYPIAKSTDLFKKSIETLKRLNIIADDADCKNIPNQLTGKILTLSLLFERLKK